MGIEETPPPPLSKLSGFGKLTLSLELKHFSGCVLIIVLGLRCVLREDV